MARGRSGWADAGDSIGLRFLPLIFGTPRSLFRGFRPLAQLICAGVTIIGLLIISSPSRGGDFHSSSSLACSDCHVIHYSESHSMAGAAPPAVPLGSGGPFPRLLRQSASQLCLACHDARTDAPDVLGANAGPYIRAAGGLNRVGDTGEYAEGNGHTLGSTNPPPGGVWTGNQTGGLQCVHCHDRHGNQYYRNLTPNPGTATGKFVTYLTGSTYSGTVAVQQLVVTPMSNHYAVGNILYRQAQVGTTDFGLSEWCSGCHGDYHGIGGSTNMAGSPNGDLNTGTPWLRHPTRDVTMARGVTNKHLDPNHWFSTLTSRVPVVSPSGIVPGTSGASDNQVFCGSCHKAHGSNHRAGLIYDDDATASAEDGTSLMQTCQQCHFQ
jgi:hypothetical protein